MRSQKLTLQISHQMQKLSIRKYSKIPLDNYSTGFERTIIKTKKHTVRFFCFTHAGTHTQTHHRDMWQTPL